MEKNTILAIVLSTLVLVASFFIQYKFFTPVEAPESPQQAELANEAASQPAENSANAALESAVAAVVAEDDDSQNYELTYTLRTNVVAVTFSNKGGDIISYELLDHKDGGKPLQMVENVREDPANRAFSLSLGGAENPAIDDIFTVKVINDYTVGFYKKLAVKNADGTEGVFTLVKQYTFEPDEYVFRLDIIINGEGDFRGLNFGNVAYTLRTPPQIGPHYEQKSNKYEYRAFMAYSGEKKRKQMLSPGQTREYDKPYTWTGVAGKYFTALVAPASADFAKALYSMRYDSNPEYSNAQVFLTRNPTSSQKSQDTFYVFMGPRTESALKKYNNVSDNSWKISGLRLNDCMESSNILGWLEVILKFIMEIFYKMIPNWGVSIILMTILLKLALFPLTKKQSLSTLKMQELQPRIQELQAKYKNQPEKLNQEMAKFYQETGYNPMSGCLPMLIQFPLIIAMYNLFNNYFEFRGAMFIPGWIPDLSVGDKVGVTLPLIGVELHILPIIYVVSQLISTKIMQAATPPQQGGQSMKLMMYIMPLVFFFVIYSAPSGLILYWTLSNFLQLGQQMIINKLMKEKCAEMDRPNLKLVNPSKPANKKKGAKK